MCIGDLDEILSDKEKSSSNRRKRRKILTFQNIMSSASLLDQGFMAKILIWCNENFDRVLVKECIDRVFGPMK